MIGIAIGITVLHALNICTSTALASRLTQLGVLKTKPLFSNVCRKFTLVGTCFGGLPAGSHHEIFTAATYPILLGCILFLIASELTSADFGQV